MKYKTIIIFTGLMSVLSLIFFLWYMPHKIERDCANNALAISVRKDTIKNYDKYIDMCIKSGGVIKFKEIIENNKPDEDELKADIMESRPALIEVVPSITNQ